MWVDEMYQQAMTPEDKTFGYWPNAKAARFIFDKKVEKQMIYRVFSQPPVGSPLCEGNICEPANPTRHSDFNDDAACFWRAAFWGATRMGWKDEFNDLPPWALQECRSQTIK
jgi:hypothetical protein